jgi:hypothetical protein
MWLDKNTGNTIPKAKEIQVGGVSYPKSIFNDAEQLTSLNIVKYSVDSIPNARYYTYEEVIDSANARITRTPIAKDIDEVKAVLIGEVKDLQAKKLEATDWYYIREMRSGIAVPQEIKDESEYIYTKSKELEDEINGLSTIEEIINFENFQDGTTLTDEEGNEFPKVINKTREW